jgi:hypothetical protein
MKDDTLGMVSAAQTEAGLHFGKSARFFMGKNTQFLESLLKSNSAMVKTSLELTQQVLDFSKARLQANAEAWKANLGCRDLRELPALQLEFTKQANAHYAGVASNFINRVADGLVTAAASCGETSSKN